MERIRIAGILLGLGLLSACGHDRRALKQGQVRDVWTAQSDAETIRVRGIGSASEGTKTDTLRKGRARAAALANARYELASLLKGVRLQGGTSVASLIEKDSRVRETMDQIVAGAEEMMTEFTADGGAVVLVEIPRAKVERMLQDTAEREAVAVSTGSLDEQIRLSEARAADQRARLPGMAAAQ